MNIIPTKLTDFLYWLKEQTETVWAQFERGNSEDNWLGGAKWIGMKEADIELIEKQYEVKFTPEHREFLKILHAVDRKEIREYTDSWEEDAEVLTKEVPFFYNWYEDEEEIRSRLTWPYDTISTDVLGSNGVWLKSWGSKPASEEEKKRIFTDWYKAAPALIPLLGHRFLVSDTQLADRPVLSVYGSDIIVYGWDLRHYLMQELGYMLDLYTDEGGEESTELGKEAEAIHLEKYEASKSKTIPFWEEMILYWSSGWSSFGKVYPRTGDGPQPIVNTYSEEDKENSQKIFPGF